MIAARGDRHGHQEREREEQGVISVQTQRSQQDLAAHCGVAVALREAEIDPPGEERGQKNKSFGRRYKSERLIRVGRQEGGQVGGHHPNKH